MAAPSLDATLARAKANWARIIQFASFIVLSVPFLFAPPSAATDSGTSKYLASIVATAAIVLVIVAGMRWSRKRDLPIWWALTAMLLVASLASFFFYDRAVARLTCQYRGYRIVIGTEFTSQAESHRKAAQLTTCDSILAEFAGKVGDVWVPQTIARASTTLAILHVCTVGVFATLFVSIMQLLGLVFDSGLSPKKPANSN